MWTTIDKETYMRKVAGLKPIESFTDPDGTMQFSCGKPQIVTVWGIVGAKGEDDTPIVKCEMRKEDRHQLEWSTEYFEYIIYDTTKEQCKTLINGVCAGCGGALEPIETVTNSGKPTFWSHCPACGVFDWGISPQVFTIAQAMVIEHNHVHYGQRVLPKDEGDKQYWISNQIRGTSRIVSLVLQLNEKLNPAGGQSSVHNMNILDPKEGEDKAVTTEQAQNAQESASQDQATGATESAEEVGAEG